MGFEQETLPFVIVGFSLVMAVSMIFMCVGIISLTKDRNREVIGN